MNERAKLLELLSAAEFACWDVRLYLDTHPDDKKALDSEKEYSNRAAMLRADYEKRYGSLTGKPCANAEGWSWINDPWPWDNI